MAAETFVDTSGFHALLIRGDRWHRPAADLMARAARDRLRFVTTDYVLDESVTLLKARGRDELIAPLLDTIEASTALRIEWTTAARFREAAAFCLRFGGKSLSFTDYLSFVVMRAHGMQDALTSDFRFAQAGFRVLLGA